MPLAANGEMCNVNCECMSDACYNLGLLGGLCGECLDDDDCPAGGCTGSTPLTMPPQGSVCNDGSLGSGCQTDNACQAPLLCAQILDVPGVIESYTCSECLIDDDCGTDLCTPVYDLLALSGRRICVEPGSLANGEACDLEGSGAAACTSGLCATADIMGLFQLGVCSECIDDADCSMGICQLPEVDFDTGLLTPSFCV